MIFNSKEHTVCFLSSTDGSSRHLSMHQRQGQYIAANQAPILCLCKWRHLSGFISSWYFGPILYCLLGLAEFLPALVLLLFEDKRLWLLFRGPHQNWLAETAARVTSRQHLPSLWFHLHAHPSTVTIEIALMLTEKHKRCRIRILRKSSSIPREDINIPPLL